MKSIKTDKLKEGVKKVIESLRDSNDDVSRYGSEKIVNGLIKDLENDSIKKQEVLGELNKIKQEIGKI